MPTQEPSWRTAERQCSLCGSAYHAIRFWQRYCSPQCCHRAYMRRHFIDLRDAAPDGRSTGTPAPDAPQSAPAGRPAGRRPSRTPTRAASAPAESAPGTGSSIAGSSPLQCTAGGPAQEPAE